MLEVPHIPKINGKSFKSYYCLWVGLDHLEPHLLSYYYSYNATVHDDNIQTGIKWVIRYIRISSKVGIIFEVRAPPSCIIPGYTTV